MSARVNKLWVCAAALAVLAHLVLLSLPGLSPSDEPRERHLAVTLQNEVPSSAPVELQKESTTTPLAREDTQATKPLANQPSIEERPPEQPTEQTISAEQALDDETPKPTISLSSNSPSLARFLRSELQRDQRAFPNAAQDFADTFEASNVAPEPPTEIAYAQGPLGGGQYKVHKNGKVYCVLQMVAQSFDDINGNAFPAASKDCSPAPRFDPKLRINTLE